MIISLDCPKCKESFEYEEEVVCSTDRTFETECPNCEVEIVYEIQWEPLADNVRIMPECRLVNHIYDEGHDYGEFVRYKCLHCGDLKHKSKITCSNFKV